MAQPQAYNREVDFTERDGDDTNHAGINAELDAAALSINEIRDNLALIQRDDGGLQNGIVTAESLAPSAFDAVLANVNEAVQDAQTAANSATLAATTAIDARDDAQAAETAAETAATAASLNATTAVTKAAEALASATAAAASATTATTKASEASTSAAAALASQNAAATSATNAAASATSALTSLNQFKSQYYGPLASDPTTDPLGNPPTVGDLYTNTTTGRLRLFGGTSWQEGNAGSISVQNFSGNGSQTAFTLATTPQAEENTQVYISGVYQQKSEYSISGTTLTFTSAPPTGTNNIEVVTMSVLPLGTTDAILVNTTAEPGGLWATVQGFINWMKGRWDALTSTSGASLVGFDGSTVQTVLDDAKPMQSYTALRAYTGRATGVRITQQGIAGFFQRDASDTTSADNGGTVIVDTSGRRWKRLFVGPVSVKWFGVVGDGLTNDTTAIQAAIDSLAATGGVVHFPPGMYRIARNVGTNDRWGIKVPHSNITLRGDQATLRRFNTDISTYALAYPIVFVGTPDSNAASATKNVTITGIHFQGENTRHNIDGGAPSDFRDSIHFKNTSNTEVVNCRFTKIDSTSIYYQHPVSYDYANTVYYNTTKNYQSKITGCSFISDSHSTAGRAIIHNIECSGIDGLLVDHNRFEWCDDCISGDGTYDDINDVETDTYTPTVSGWTLGAVKRVGRNITFSNNYALNSSEHAVYLGTMDTSITGNTCRVENPSICLGDIKTRGRNVSITGNTVTAQNVCVAIAEPSFNVTVSGNNLQPLSEGGGGVVEIVGNGLVSYISNRSDFLTTYYPMFNINITGNNITFPSTAPATALQHICVRIYGPSGTLAQYPDYIFHNINITGNSFYNYEVGVYVITALMRTVNVDGNMFYGKPYSGAFSGSTAMKTYAPLVVNSGLTYVLNQVKFTNNVVEKSKYIVATHNGAGSFVFGPNLSCGNLMNYIQNYKTSDVRVPDYDLSSFTGNRGSYFLDRTGWAGAYSINNNLSDSGASNPYRKYNIAYNGTNIVFYTNDSGTSVILG